MGITVSQGKGSSDFEIIDPGVYHAICYGVVDLGTHEGEYNGQLTIRHQILVIWELPFETIEIDGNTKPRAISKFYTLSLHEKSNLRKDLRDWRGKDFTAMELIQFDVSKLIGANCQLNVIHKDRKDGSTIAVVGSIMPLSKGTKKLSAFNDDLYFSFEDGMTIPENCPDWIVSIIMRSQEWNETGQQDVSHEDLTDNDGEDIAF